LAKSLLKNFGGKMDSHVDRIVSEIGKKIYQAMLIFHRNCLTRLKAGFGVIKCCEAS